MKSWKIALITILSVFSFVIFLSVSAQTNQPKIFLTWQAQSYAPPYFQGKLLPAAFSPIMVSFEVIDGGKIADLSRETVYWYVNDKFFQGGTGLKRMTLRAPDIAGNPIEVRVELPAYPPDGLLKTIDIPTTKPEAVIEAPFPADQFFSSQIRVIGHPYFFNARDAGTLNFSWRVNNEAVETAENPEVLDITLNQDAPTGANLTVTLTIENPASLFEKAVRSLNLVFIK